MSKTRILCSSLRPIEFLRRISNETAPSSLPISVVEGGRAFPGECGVLGRLGCPVLGTLSPGLLDRCDAVASQRPIGAPSVWSRGGRGEGCEHADGAPVACLVAGRTDLEALPEGSPV